MSFNTTFKSYDELIDYLKTVSDPRCFTVNYLPLDDKFELWIGNQPYHTYEELIELEQKEKEYLKRDCRLISEENASLYGKIAILEKDENLLKRKVSWWENTSDDYLFENIQLKKDIEIYKAKIKDLENKSRIGD